MDLQEQTELFIYDVVTRYYYKAIEHGAKLSKLNYKGCNLYKIWIGNKELTYIGTADGTAKLIGNDGDIF